MARGDVCMVAALAFLSGACSSSGAMTGAGGGARGGVTSGTGGVGSAVGSTGGTSGDADSDAATGDGAGMVEVADGGRSPHGIFVTINGRPTEFTVRPTAETVGTGLQVTAIRAGVPAEQLTLRMFDSAGDSGGYDCQSQSLNSLSYSTDTSFAFATGVTGACSIILTATGMPGEDVSGTFTATLVGGGASSQLSLVDGRFHVIREN